MNEVDAADVRGPYGGALHNDGRSEIAVVAATGSTQVLDLSTSTYFNGLHYIGKFVRLTAEADCYYYWTNNGSALLDETATGGTTREKQCDILKSGIPYQESPAGQYLVIKQASGKLRIAIMNQVKP